MFVRVDRTSSARHDRSRCESRPCETPTMTSHASIVPNENAKLDGLRDKTVAILGYGSQGSAHARNLRESGCRVVVAQRPNSQRHASAVEDGFEPMSIAAAVRAGDLIVFALPDDAAPDIFDGEIRPTLRPGATLGFMHGFVIHYELITPPETVDVVLVAPKAQGRGVRDEFVAGRGVAALIAVHQDATGRARETALAWAAGIGANRAGIMETSFKDETETDLFGEQAVLCGGMTTLIKLGFETLVEAGYPPELAYFECCHEIKLLADLIHDGGVTYMRERISSTARFGDLTRGPRLAEGDLRDRMRSILADIRSRQFATEFIEDSRAGAPHARELSTRDAEHPIEQVGRTIRELIWGVNHRNR